jgi:hypothetical protein
VNRIDVNWLHKEGYLRPGWSGALQWTQEGKREASINLEVEEDSLRLSYRVRIAGGEWVDVVEDLSITRVPCRFGGTRPYFLCPGVVEGVACGRRAAKLYAAGRYFLCRRCYRLTYTSQSEGALDRAFRHADKIRQRLGGDPRGLAPPQRPKGMWGRTFERLYEKAVQAESRAYEASITRAQQLLARVDNSNQKGDR